MVDVWCGYIHTVMRVYVYIILYIYIERERERDIHIMHTGCNVI